MGKADAQSERLKSYIKQRFTEIGVNETWDRELARAWGKSPRTVRGFFEEEDFAKKNREYLLETAYVLGFDLVETDNFLKNKVGTNGIYNRNTTDAAYYYLLCNREKLKSEAEACRREEESVAEWARRILPSYFLNEKADRLELWLREYYDQKDRKWDKRALANDIGIDRDILSRGLRRCLTENREMALAIAVSSEMDIKEANEFLSLCENLTEINLDKPLDALYFGRLQSITDSKDERRQGESISHWARRIGGKELFDKRISVKNTTFYNRMLKDSSRESAVETGRTLAENRQQCQKTLQVFNEWIAGTWLEKNAGNRKWHDNGFEEEDIKKEWDRLRNILENGVHSVPRDDLIKMGLMLRMYLGKMNDILKTAGYNELQKEKGHIFEQYLYVEWNGMTDEDAGTDIYPRDSNGELTKHMPYMVSDENGEVIWDFCGYFSELIDGILKDLSDYFEKEEADNTEIRDEIRRIHFDMKNPPGWYIPEDKRKSDKMRRIDGIIQVIKHYGKMTRGKKGAAQEVFSDIGKLPDKAKNPLESQIIEMINYHLPEWGFRGLDYELKIDQRVIEKINEFTADYAGKTPNKEKLDKLAIDINNIYNQAGEGRA